MFGSWYVWQCIGMFGNYCHDVIDNNKSFNFSGNGQKGPSVLLGTQVAFLNKQFNQNIEINNLLIDIEC